MQTASSPEVVMVEVVAALFALALVLFAFTLAVIAIRR